ncbi:MAG: hypothetical protein GF398_07525 [Chitinivibrionales bacterium]|nr:hypothetical protein [Chitinivibrionales bacterium]
MKERTERIVKVGLKRTARKIFDDVEITTARMQREGWHLCDQILEESLGNMHLFFERDIQCQTR